MRTMGRATRFPTGPRGSDGAAPRDAAARGGWMLLGLLSFHDPPRADAAYAIRVAKELGVRVAIVSGGDAREARELCRAVGLPTHVAGAECLGVPLDLVRLTTTNRTTNQTMDQTNTTSSGTHSIPETLEAERAGAFAAMSRLDRGKLATLLRRRGRTVCAIGASVADDDAFRAASVSVASRAASTSAATLNAADVTITSPGLAGLLHAIVSSRSARAHVRGLTVHRVAVACQVLLFYAIAGALARPDDFAPGWPRTFRVPVTAMCVLCVVDAATVAALAAENPCRNVPPGRRPDSRSRAPVDVVDALVAGSVHAFANLAFLGIALGDSTERTAAREKTDAGRRPGGSSAAALAG